MSGDFLWFSRGDGPSPSPRPPKPTRDQLCQVRTSGMQGLWVQTPSFGRVAWFDPYITSPELTADDRKAVYAAKKAFVWPDGTVGDTHFLLALSWNYAEPGVKFGSLGRAPQGFDGTQDWDRLLTLYDEILDAGFYVSLHMAGDGLSVQNPDGSFAYNDPQGWTFGWQWLMARLGRMRALIGDDRSAYTVWTPGFDGCVPGWAGPENDWHRTNEYLVHARDVLGPDAVLAVYLSAGYWAWSGEHDDYSTPDGQNVDVAYYEGPVPFGPRIGSYPGKDNGSSWDQIWQISKRLLRSKYKHPSDQPSDDDPGTIGGGYSTPRGPMYPVFVEICTYDWVRERISEADVAWERNYSRNIGWEWTG